MPSRGTLSPLDSAACIPCRRLPPSLLTPISCCSPPPQADSTTSAAITSRAHAIASRVLGPLHWRSIVLVRRLVIALTRAGAVATGKGEFRQSFELLGRALALTTCVRAEALAAAIEAQRIEAGGSLLGGGGGGVGAGGLDSLLMRRPSSRAKPARPASAKPTRPGSANPRGRPNAATLVAAVHASLQQGSSASAAAAAGGLGSRPPSAAAAAGTGAGAGTARTHQVDGAKSAAIVVDVGTVWTPAGTKAYSPATAPAARVGLLLSLRLEALNGMACAARQAGELRTALAVIKESLAIYAILDDAAGLAGIGAESGVSTGLGAGAEDTAAAGGDKDAADAATAEEEEADEGGYEGAPLRGLVAQEGLHAFLPQAAGSAKDSAALRVPLGALWAAAISRGAAGATASSGSDGKGRGPGAVEVRTAVQDGAAVTHLNMCAVLSELGRYDRARRASILSSALALSLSTRLSGSVLLMQSLPLLARSPPFPTASHARAFDHAQRAMAILQASLILLEASQATAAAAGASPSSSGAGAAGGASRSLSPSLAGKMHDLLSFLGAAHHNAAVELEHLRRYDEAIALYASARDLAAKYVGPTATMTATFAAAHKAAVREQERRRMEAAMKDRVAELQRARRNASYTYINPFSRPPAPVAAGASAPASSTDGGGVAAGAANPTASAGAALNATRVRPASATRRKTATPLQPVTRY